MSSLTALTDPTKRSTLASATAGAGDPNVVPPSQTSSGQSRRQRAEEKEREKEKERGMATATAGMADGRDGVQSQSRRDGSSSGTGGTTRPIRRNAAAATDVDLADKIIALQRRQAGGSGTTARTRESARKPSAVEREREADGERSNGGTGGRDRDREQDRNADRERGARDRDRENQFSRDHVGGENWDDHESHGYGQGGEGREGGRDRRDAREISSGARNRYHDEYDREVDRTSSGPGRTRSNDPYQQNQRSNGRIYDASNDRRAGSSSIPPSPGGGGSGRDTSRNQLNGGRGRLNDVQERRGEEEDGRAISPGMGGGEYTSDEVPELDPAGHRLRRGAGFRAAAVGGRRNGGTGSGTDSMLLPRGQGRRLDGSTSTTGNRRRGGGRGGNELDDEDAGDDYGSRGQPSSFGPRGGGNAGLAETTDRIRRDVDRLYRPGQAPQATSRQEQYGSTSRHAGHSSDTPSQSQSQGYQGQGPMRKLFDPTRHDPVNFGRQTAMSTSTGTGGSTATGMYSSRTGGSSVMGDGHGGRALRQGSSLATSISIDSHGPKDKDRSTLGNVPPPSKHSRNNGLGPSNSAALGELDDDVVADKERERRKRREGSERGSQKKRDDATRGSRSSEGSESLKDRERGRGKSDTGIMSRLREAYKFIQGLETALTEMHRKMSADPSNGVRALLHAGLLGQNSHAPYANPNAAPIFNPAMGQGAIGVLRQAEDDEDEFDRSRPLPTAASRAAKQAQNLVIDADREDEAWVELIAKHKRLSDAHHDFLSLSLDPLIPASLHTLPVRYNIAARLWQVGFHLLLERMRYTWIANAPSNQTGMQHAFSASSRVAGSVSQKDTIMSQRVLEHLTDFIYDAYSFYTNLLEEQVLSNFKTAWIEALGDLARYRMAVASQVAANEVGGSDAAGEKETARIDDMDADDNAQPFPSGASIGAEVAQSWNLEERETWRTCARDWYVMGLSEKPGEGRLHHHLALLCRDVKGEELRGLYHFAKSLSTSHPFHTARESILPMFDNALQHRRAAPEAHAPELFVLMHGILFTRIELDTFDAVFDRYMERLEEDARLAEDEHSGHGRKAMSQTQWLLMAIVNLSALMQYGAEDGFVRKALAEDSAARKVNRNAQQTAAPPVILNNATIQTNQDKTRNGESNLSEEDVEMPVEAGLRKLQIESSATPRPEDPASYPSHFQKAIKLCFSVLTFCLRRPVRQAGLHVVLNPYITVFLTFLGTAMKQTAVHALLERFVPWAALVDFFNTIPRKIEVRDDVSMKLMGGPPIPEDWCVRGMEWVGRRVYERGFWKAKSNSAGGRGSAGPAEPKSGPRITSEMDVLLGEQDITTTDAVDGVVDDADGQDNVDSPGAVTQRRWKRTAWAGASLASCTLGLAFVTDAPRKLAIAEKGKLAQKIRVWTAEEMANAKAELRQQRKEEEARGEWTSNEAIEDADRLDNEDEDENEPELRELRDRRRYLRSLLTAPGPTARTTSSIRPTTKPAKAKKSAGKLSVLPGYTVLVFDTNVLLSSLELFQKLTGSLKWTIVVPLPVITELDGLCKQPGDLGLAATTAVSYLEAHIRRSAISLKVQTSKGNYLSDLVVRTESLDRKYEVTDLDAETVRAQTMDDFILRVAVFQMTNFNDRSAILGTASEASYEDQKRSAPKVMLLTFDRNLRLRARARGVEAADDKEMARILGTNG